MVFIRRARELGFALDAARASLRLLISGSFRFCDPRDRRTPTSQ